MADVKINTPVVTTANNDRLIYMNGQHGTTSVFVFQITPASSWDGVITVQSRVHVDDPTRTPPSFLPTPYQKFNVAGTVADGTFATATLSSTTGSHLILVDAAGRDVALSIASATTGTVTVTVKKMRG
jgi:hypothetical protein